MGAEIFADRFLRSTSGWLDLATGDRVRLVIQSAGPDPCEPCAIESDRRDEEGRLRIDAGGVGASSRFEAWTTAAVGPAVNWGTACASKARDLVELGTLVPTGVRLVYGNTVSEADAWSLGCAVAAHVRAAGIVPLRGGLDVSPDLKSALLRRHLAILCYRPQDENGTVDWIRRLTGRIPRAHLVFDLRPRGGGMSASCRAGPIVVAREREPGYRATDWRLQRARGLLARGRRAAASRWFRAAVESSRRRDDEESQARAALELAAKSASQDQWIDARRVLLDVLSRLRSWHARAAIAAETARALVALGELSQADGLLSALGAEAGVLGQEVPASMQLQLAQVRFWQGRFEEARELMAQAVGDSAEMVLWRNLTAWAIDASAMCPCPPDEMDTPSSLARACRVERLLAEGSTREAVDALATVDAPGAEAYLDRALHEWLRSKAGAHAAPAAICEFIRRTGARGITRFGLGRSGMHLLQAVPALLRIIQDADDDVMVLTQGCGWIREHAGAVSAGVVACEGSRFIAGDRMAPMDLTEELMRDALQSEHARAVARGGDVVVTAPVRCQGVTIGIVIARGAASAATTLSEAAMALAALCAPALRARLDQLSSAETGRTVLPEILGHSPAVRAVREAIVKAAATPFPVLIEGESGTGKELVARAVHRLSSRRDRRFCAINCAALTDELVEAELFGFTRGAFTGAVGPRAGLFEEAHGGTLFLDEVGELSPRAQAKLLRVLQEREIRRLGENAPRAIDVRVVAATNRVLADAAGLGQFREDLRFRLAVVRLRTPALREHVEDVPVLAHAFWTRLIAETSKRASLGPDAVAALCRHRWPGNVRELQNAIAALVVIAPVRGRVTSRHVGQVLAADAGGGQPLEAARRTFERQMVSAALARHAGRRTAAARELGLSRQGLTKAIKRLGVIAT